MKPQFYDLWIRIESVLNSYFGKDCDCSSLVNEYKNFDKDKNTKSCALEEMAISIDPIDIRDYQDQHLIEFLEKFCSYVKIFILPYTLGAFFHGSIATNDYTSYSDADVALIVKDTVMQDSHSLRTLKHRIRYALKLMLEFDNLQHHGFFIIPEGFLQCFPEDYLPTRVLKCSRSLYGVLKFDLRTFQNKEYADEKFLKMAKFFTEKRFKKLLNRYEVKHILSQFLLLPTLYLQAKGVYVYKKFSFALVKKDFPDDWWVIDEVSQIRQHWVRSKSMVFDRLLDILPNPWFASLICRKFDWKTAPCFSDVLSGQTYEGMRKLASKMMAAHEQSDIAQPC